jgi:hypothetical protein
VLEAVGRDGRGLRITFRWDEDRFGHEISCLAGAAATVCLTAELGRDQDPWPASPALQQLSVEELQPGRPSALLVGMAGQSHWSQCVDAEPATTSLTFDVACRVQREPQWLGSRYRAHHDAACPPTPAGRIALGGGVELTIELAADSPPARITGAGGPLVIAPDLRVQRFPSTVRWKYRISLHVATASPGGAVF